ncbi:MAG: glycine--tRNA ligase [Candidatus Nealsonbacteria bacterium CG02_land_8_20_14_3_00_34_20]|uniref:Glycine--tRNA ligase n=1 Tax=Candidatus Nealsonbacteria bacterium CG02_land_8_20_14_3_00_34_20 TaxID=1974698 RepID=A0A2M7DAG2_9BACT|nr:MAG: glycine--tRNA ligase [Candidatus Nealsonbacteria bacterium CG02_land_8_20_14_3_00_34_20]
MANTLEKIISLSKRRGFIFPSSDIYGGIGGFYDFGPLGVEMKNNIKRIWWKNVVQQRKEVVGLDSSIIMNSKIWEASGHTQHFTDPLCECKKCHKRFRADHLVEKLKTPGKLDEHGTFNQEELKDIAKVIPKIKCPECGGELTPPRQFNLMFKTFIGPVEEETAKTYLRPETAQGIFVNYKNILDTQRVKVPFGIAQVGKAFRNEITPGNFIFRTREFEQMELEYFVKPGEDEKSFDYWVKERMRWYIEDLAITEEKLRIRPHRKDELAHYAKSCVDIEYKFPFGWSEIEGIANRTDFDLKQHQENSGVDLRYFDEPSAGRKQYYIPYVIEPSCGVERIMFALLCDAYQEIKGGRTETTKAAKEVEILLKLDKKLAPIKVAVLPLVKNKPELVKKAKEVFELLKPYFMCQYDEVGSIGRRYRRQDETGTVFCLTLDFESLEQNDLTIRYRDTMKQERVKIKDLIKVLKEKLEN